MEKSYIDKLLDIDPIAIVEDASGGKHWSEFDNSDNIMALGLAMMSGEIKRNALKQAGDTYWGMKWDEFQSLIESHGFKCALRYDIPYENKTEEAIIYYDTNGFVIWATSFFGKTSINGGTLYGQIKEEKGFLSSDLHHCSHGCFADDKWHFDVDVREGLFHNINSVLQNATPLKVWEYDSFLWLVDYVEENELGYDYKKITEDKINSSPELKRILSVCISTMKEV